LKVRLEFPPAYAYFEANGFLLVGWHYFPATMYLIKIALLAPGMEKGYDKNKWPIRIYYPSSASTTEVVLNMHHILQPAY
jgi:hypothetical protein